MFLKLGPALESPGRLAKWQTADWEGLKTGLKVCISNMFPSDADAADSGTMLWEALQYIDTYVLTFNEMIQSSCSYPKDLIHA